MVAAILTLVVVPVAATGFMVGYGHHELAEDVPPPPTRAEVRQARRALARQRKAAEQRWELRQPR